MTFRKSLLKTHRKFQDFLGFNYIARSYPIRKLSGFLLKHLRSSTMVQGHKMFLDSKDSLDLFNKGVYEAFETKLVKKEIKRGDIIIDIGANIGYYSLIFAKIVGEKGKVLGIELIPELKDFGQENAQKYNFVKSERTIFICGDGSKGLPEEAPFDRIHVAAASVDIPEHLLKQLKMNGKMIVPVGVESQELVLIEKTGEKMYKEQRFPGFLFVPLVTH